MTEKFSSDSRNIFEKKQREAGNVDYSFDLSKKLQIGDFDSGNFYCLFLQSKNYTGEIDFWGRKVYLRPGFNILDLLEKNAGLGIEIGGPTDEGYEFFNIEVDPTENILKTDIINLFEKYSEKNKIFVSNILPAVYSFLGGGEIKVMGIPHFIADGALMPIKEKEVNVIFISNIGKITFRGILALKEKGIDIPQKEIEDLKKEAEEIKNLSQDEKYQYIINQRKKFIRPILEEAFRLLKNGGILVLNGTFPEDVFMALEVGFDIVQIEYVAYLKNGQKNFYPDKAIFIKKEKEK